MVEYKFTKVSVDLEVLSKTLENNTDLAVGGFKTIKFFSSPTNNLSIIFANSINSSLFSILQGIVDSHAILTIEPYKLTNQTDCPQEIDFRIYGLYKKRTIDKDGFLWLIEYYRYYDEATSTYSDLVVDEQLTYLVNPQGLATKRIKLIQWYKADESIGCTKVVLKYYSVANAIKESIRRRDNLVDSVKAYGLTNITGVHATGIPNAYHFLLQAQLSGTLDLFRQGMLTALTDYISTSTEPYLTSQLKNDMVNILLSGV